MDHATLLQGVGLTAGIVAIILLCLVGIVLSLLTLSGTWVIAGAALIGMFLPLEHTPGWLTLGIFLLASTAVEVIEAVSGAWGVERKGGSRLAGFAAFGGGIVGLFVGILIPVPIAGPLIGMLALSFLAAFLVEQRRLKKSSQAADIALGALVGRVLVLFLKVAATLAMIAWLTASFLVV